VLFTGVAASEPQFPRGVIGASAIPFFVGVALLVEYRTRRNQTRE